MSILVTSLLLRRQKTIYGVSPKNSDCVQRNSKSVHRLGKSYWSVFYYHDIRKTWFSHSVHGDYRRKPLGILRDPIGLSEKIKNKTAEPCCCRWVTLITITNFTDWLSFHIHCVVYSTIFCFISENSSSTRKTFNFNKKIRVGVRKQKLYIRMAPFELNDFIWSAFLKLIRH